MWVSRKDADELYRLLSKVGDALVAILPEPIAPRAPRKNATGYDFGPVFAAAEAVKRSEQRVADKEILKVVKRMRGEA